MKTTLLGLLAIAFSVTCFAQNTNVQQEVKTTTTTIKNSDGVKKIVKKEKINEVQNIELHDAESKKLNKEMKDTPVQVTSTTEVTVDGVTRAVDVDRSAYYLGENGAKYQVATDKTGYSVVIPNAKTPALLRRTSNNNYVYVNKGKVSVGYFDKDGNLVLETYDEKTDKMSLEKFTLVKP
jgi:broad specificity polyphosphatase/5'/3'-nucleotidase SurE